MLSKWCFFSMNVRHSGSVTVPCSVAAADDGGWLTDFLVMITVVVFCSAAGRVAEAGGVVAGGAAAASAGLTSCSAARTTSMTRCSTDLQSLGRATVFPSTDRVASAFPECCDELEARLCKLCESASLSFFIFSIISRSSFSHCAVSLSAVCSSLRARVTSSSWSIEDTEAAALSDVPWGDSLGELEAL
uniref:Uncharacterized protein n=1 Tax=Ixodes ricinus TaxID=34613 RepID=A0A6B0V1C0_IXORI